MMKLFNFAYFHNYEEKIKFLANLCQEKWSFGNNNDNIILKNYIQHTFLRLKDENKIIEKDDYALFNTGLYDEFYQQIFAHFKKNKNQDRQPWFFNNFYNEYELENLCIADRPKRANYFTNPAELVFDANCDIVLQYSHIFNDPENIERLPESLKEDHNRIMLFEGAVNKVKKMINANYKTAVPQYYKGKIQLLIPIYLKNIHIPDLALVVSKNSETNNYSGHTCLTLDMAYNNARLIAKPDSNWLKP